VERVLVEAAIATSRLENLFTACEDAHLDSEPARPAFFLEVQPGIQIGVKRELVNDETVAER
jgi:hypothetical protein